jgi:hypothetical protein
MVTAQVLGRFPYRTCDGKFGGMPEQLAARMSIASLNTRGVPIRGSRLAGRYAAIGTAFEAAPVEVACFQEVLTYGHLRLLARRMPSFGHVSYRRSVAGPAGGLVTFSRLPVAGSVRFPAEDSWYLLAGPAAGAFQGRPGDQAGAPRRPGVCLRPHRPACGPGRGAVIGSGAVQAGFFAGR